MVAAQIGASFGADKGDWQFSIFCHRGAVKAGHAHRRGKAEQLAVQGRILRIFKSIRIHIRFIVFWSTGAGAKRKVGADL